MSSLGRKCPCEASGPSRSGLRRAAAGAGGALRAADAVGRAAVLRDGLRLLDLLSGGCLTWTKSRRGRKEKERLDWTGGTENVDLNDRNGGMRIH